mmetsp:Transcript_98610/g.276140  ORF Transcript_98610/g.276140 Transcript_98610/m.276140 type:complete len:210 (-) Transcript_98610:143-772(-)
MQVSKSEAPRAMRLMRPGNPRANQSLASLNSSRSPTIHNVSSASTIVTAWPNFLSTPLPVIGCNSSLPHAYCRYASQACFTAPLIASRRRAYSSCVGTWSAGMAGGCMYEFCSNSFKCSTISRCPAVSGSGGIMASCPRGQQACTPGFRKDRRTRPPFNQHMRGGLSLSELKTATEHAPGTAAFRCTHNEQHCSLVMDLAATSSLPSVR